MTTHFVKWVTLVAGLGVGMPQAALAQAAVPYGLWQGQAAGDFLLVQVGGACSASGLVNVSGTCAWLSTSTGGVLTMTYQWAAGPAQLSWSIRWLDQGTLLVNGVERFVRRGG